MTRAGGGTRLYRRKLRTDCLSERNEFAGARSR